MDRLCGQSQASSVLHRTHPAQPLLGPRLVVVSQIPVEHAAELGDRDARPVAMVEELVLEPSEEALHRRAVGAAPLLRHRPDQAVPVANRNPPGPAVVASAVGVGRQPLPFGKSLARGLEAGVGEPRVRARPYRPGRQPPSKQSRMDDGQALPSGRPNSVMSASHGSLGADAWKSLPARLSGASEISPS